MNKTAKILLVALLVGVGLLLAKVGAYWLTGSNSILTDALESIINVAAGAFGLYSYLISLRPQDNDHPYGHGKIEFISASIEGSLIFVAGISMVLKAAYNFFHPSVIQSVDLGLWIVLATGIVNYILGEMLERTGKKQKSVLIVASAKHLKSDAYSTAGLVAGLAVIFFTQAYWLDNLLAVGFGALICYTGYKIVRESVAGIMDEADFALLQEIISAFEKQRQECWIDIHNLRIIKYGAFLHIDCHITLPWYFSIKQAEAEVGSLTDQMKEKYSGKAEVFVHLDPCVPASCGLCLLSDCAVRSAPFVKKSEWSLQNVLGESQHS